MRHATAAHEEPGADCHQSCPAAAFSACAHGARSCRLGRETTGPRVTTQRARSSSTLCWMWSARKQSPVTACKVCIQPWPHMFCQSLDCKGDVGWSACLRLDNTVTRRAASQPALLTSLPHKVQQRAVSCVMLLLSRCSLCGSTEWPSLRRDLCVVLCCSCQGSKHVKL